MLPSIRAKLPRAEDRVFLDGLTPEETETLLEIARAKGVDYVVGTWGHLRNQVEYIRSL